MNGSSYLEDTRDPNRLILDRVDIPISASQYNIKGRGMALRVKYREVENAVLWNPATKCSS